MPDIIGPAPHAQRSQIAPVMVQEELWSRMRSLPYVYMAPTLVSVSHDGRYISSRTSVLLHQIGSKLAANLRTFTLITMGACTSLFLTG